MLKIVNSTTKKLRIALCVLFILILFTNSLPYIYGLNAEGQIAYFTPIDLLLYINATTDNTQLADGLQSLQTVAVSYIVFFIIPIVGFLFAALDKQRNLKNAAGILCSIAGVLAVIYLVGPQFLCIGSLLAMLLYLVTLFLSVLGVFARYIKTPEEQK